MRKQLIHMTHHDNFKYLTCALSLLLFSTVIAQQFFKASALHFIQSATVVTLFVAVWGVKRKHFFINKASIFPLAIILSSMTSFYLDAYGVEMIHLGLMLLFFIFTAFQTTKQVIFSGEVDTNKILGAICLYLLLGLIWALLYTLVELNYSPAFNGITSNKSWYLLFPEFIYFSFVTLTTLGYGDIAPALPISKFLVYFQAVVGQFYLAILVASLVGARMSNLRQEKGINDER